MMEWDNDIVKPLSGGKGLGAVDGVRFAFNGRGTGQTKTIVVRFGVDVMNRMRWVHKDRLMLRFSRARREMLVTRAAKDSIAGFSINRQNERCSGIINVNPLVLPDDIAPIIKSLAAATSTPTWRDTSDGLVVSLAP